MHLVNSTETTTSSAGMVGRWRGDVTGPGPTFVLLHGLTFDRRMWDPLLDALSGDRAAVAFDLPGHGESPALMQRGMDPVVAAIHTALRDARVADPIMVGHSIGGPLAALYAARHPVSGVVSIEAPIRLEPFAATVAELRPQLEGDGFPAVWSRFQDSWRRDLVSEWGRRCLRAGERPSREVVLDYWADLLERPLPDVLAWRDGGLARIGRAGTPYVTLHSRAVDPADVDWLRRRIPQAQVVVWPVGHHFPHVSDADALARLLTQMR
jgi:pimeloyl-ACP methyl ester carboxylesterase